MSDFDNKFDNAITDAKLQIKMSEFTRLLMEKTIKEIGLSSEDADIIRAMCDSMVAEGASIAMKQVVEKLRTIQDVIKKVK